VSVYPFIAAEKVAAGNATKACVLLDVSRSAYYQWSQHIPSARRAKDAQLGERITGIHHDSRGRTGRHVCTVNCSERASAAEGSVWRV